MAVKFAMCIVVVYTRYVVIYNMCLCSRCVFVFQLGMYVPVCVCVSVCACTLPSIHDVVRWASADSLPESIHFAPSVPSLGDLVCRLLGRSWGTAGPVLYLAAHRQPKGPSIRGVWVTWCLTAERPRHQRMHRLTHRSNWQKTNLVHNSKALDLLTWTPDFTFIIIIFSLKGWRSLFRICFLSFVDGKLHCTSYLLALLSIHFLGHS